MKVGLKLGMLFEITKLRQGGWRLDLVMQVRRYLSCEAILVLGPMLPYPLPLQPLEVFAHITLFPALFVMPSMPVYTEILDVANNGSYVYSSIIHLETAIANCYYELPPLKIDESTSVARFLR